MAQKRDRGLAPEALGRLEEETCPAKSGADVAQVESVFLCRRTENQNVVEVYQDALVDERSEDLRHGALERGRGIDEAERKDLELKESISRAESREGRRVGVEGDLVICHREVELRENGGAEQAVEHVGNSGEGKRPLMSV